MQMRDLTRNRCSLQSPKGLAGIKMGNLLAFVFELIAKVEYFS